jgi:hypothetical protein
MKKLLLWTALVLPLRAAVGQERAVFGQVLDSVSGQPLQGTSAYFTTSRLEAHTNADGFFVLHGDEKRDSVIVVRRIGYVPRTIIVSPLTRMPTVDAGIVYLRPVATKLDEIAVVTEEVRRYPQLDGFYVRRAHLSGLGHFFTREIIQRTGASRASDVLRRSTKVYMDCNRRTPIGECAPASNRSREMRIRLRPADTTYTQEELGAAFMVEVSRCRMEVWVDGVRSPFNDVDEIPVSWIVGIEIYSGPETTPVEFGQGSCGVIAIWTAVPGS